MVNIPYSTQVIDETDVKAVTRVLRSEWLTTGPWVKKFEAKVAKLVGCKYAVAVANGTASLHVACLTLDIKPGDEVITVPYSFAATSNCVLYCGGTPVFVDIDPVTLCIDVNKIEPKINKKTKGIIAVDFAGLPAPWKQLKRIAKKYHLWLMNDAAHSFGSAGIQADITCFSFHPVKTITTGEGGMVVTNKRHFYERAKNFRTHGIVKKENPPWYYEMHELGFNYRLTDIQAALGVSQLKHLKKFLFKRRRLAKRYYNLLSNLPHSTLPVANDESCWHLYPVRIDFESLGKSKIQLFKVMKKNGINLQVHYIPIHLHPYYRKRFGYKKGDFPISELIYEQEVSLPLYPILSFKQQDKVVALLKQFIL